MKKLTKEIVNERLKSDDRAIRMVDDYVTDKTKSLFECLVCDHKWTPTPHNIMSRLSGCPLCHNKIRCYVGRLSKEEVNGRLLKDSRPLKLIGDYAGSHSKSLFQCLVCDHKWLTTSKNIIHNFSGCPVCSKHGYSISKPGYIYILDFGDYIKYGITNNLKTRLYAHNRNNGKYTVALSKLYEDGITAQNWERNIKIIFGGRFVSKEIMPDGYTETLSHDKLQALLDTVK